MNRRGFLDTMLRASAAFSIMPASLTYTRKWKRPITNSFIWVPNPQWITAPWQLHLLLNKEAIEVLNLPFGLKAFDTSEFHSISWVNEVTK
jgi:hypothetical protein